jgi:hypothetical protein
VTLPQNSGWRGFLWIALAVLAGLVTTLGLVAVTVAGFSLSFDASQSVAKAAHIREEIAWLLPVSVDGAMAVAAVVAVVMRHLRGETPIYPWVVVGLGAAISIVCNGLHATGEGGELELTDVQAVAVSAIPAVMLPLSIHLAVMLVELIGEVIRSGRTGQQTRSTTQPIGSSIGTPSTQSSGPARLSTGEPDPAPAESRSEAPDRVDGSGAGEPSGEPIQSGEPTQLATRSETRSSGQSGTRSMTRSKARRSGRRGKSDDQLRIELAAAQERGALPRVAPSAEAIAAELHIGLARARKLRDELRPEPALGGGDA